MLKLYEFQFNSMGCVCNLSIYCENALQAKDIFNKCYQESDRLDKYYSNYSKTSFVAKINESAGNQNGIVVDNETAMLLDYAQHCYEQSDGLFDITSGILQKAWNFKKSNCSLPAQTDIQKLLRTVGWHKVIWKKPKLVLPLSGMILDFGGIVKEYAADCLYTLCQSLGIRHGLVNMSGDIRVIGPHPDAKPWNIGITAPRDNINTKLSISVSRGAVATSGDYEKSILIDGKRYCHIINPKTGWPVFGLSSVTVVTDLCIVAGTVTTTALLMGKQKAMQWLKSLDILHYCYDDLGALL